MGRCSASVSIAKVRPVRSLPGTQQYRSDFVLLVNPCSFLATWAATRLCSLARRAQWSRALAPAVMGPGAGKAELPLKSLLLARTSWRNWTHAG